MWKGFVFVLISLRDRFKGETNAFVTAELEYDNDKVLSCILSL